MAGGKFKVLICDALSTEAVDVFRQCDQIHVDVKEGQTKDELLANVGPYHALAVRSATKISADVFDAAPNLKVVGRAGVGIDNVDVDAANRKGVIVMNTPEGNTISTAEHTLSMMFSLSRRIPQAVSAMRAGRWDRKKFMGTEVYGKTLGIVGLGRIGCQVALRAQAFGMRTIGFDPFTSEEQARKFGIERIELDEVFRRSDYITLHTPLTNETRNVVGREAFAKMKPGVRIINCARGGLVDEEALAEALQLGKVAGAALDVFMEEPLQADSPLLKIDTCITTPHLGASTEEAQTNVAVQVAEQIRDALLGHGVRNALNMPYVPPEAMAAIGPYIGLADKLGRFASQIFTRPMSKVELIYSGDITDFDLDPLNRAILKGLLTPICEETVNFINAPVLMKNRGILVAETKSGSTDGYQNLITVRVSGEDKQASVSGTIFRKNDPRIVRIDDFHVDAKPEGPMLVLRNEDVPGIIGHIGTILGDAGVNVADMSLGRESKGTYAVTILNIDTPISPEVEEKLTSLKSILAVRKVDVG